MTGDGNIDTGDNNNNDNNNNNNKIDPMADTGTENTSSNCNDKEKYLNSEDSHQSTPERWILVLAVIVLAFSVILLTLRSVLFSLILLTIGISLFAYWLYVGIRSREQSRFLSVYKSSRGDSSRITNLGKVIGGRKGGGENACSCAICKHTQSGECLQSRCPCCVLMRNKEIIGHF